MESKSTKDQEREFEETRRCLLSSYNSSIQNHAGLLIAFTIGLFELLANWQNFLYSNGFWFYAAFATFWILLAVAVGGFMFTLLRIVYWTTFANFALSVSMAQSIN